VRCFALGKVARLLKKFANQEKALRTSQKQLLKGFYTANKYEINDTKVGDEDDMFVDEICFTKAAILIEKYAAKAKQLNRNATI
jgi:hypothetical protein